MPPPGPQSAQSFTELTSRLRDLFAWSGRPKYVTLSKASGLAPSAISNLIGKRPLSRPSEAATLRFVEACLAHGGCSPRTAADQIEEWRSAWQRLDSLAEAQPDHGTPPGPRRSGGSSPSQRQTTRRWRGPILAASAAAVLVACLGVGVLIGFGILPGHAKPGDGRSAVAEPRARCHRTSIPQAHDVRNQRTWTAAFRCPNDKGAHVLLQPEPGSPVVSQLTYATSWFVCWTRGKQHPGGNAIWYYTQGDTPGSNPKVHSWGFVAANELGTEQDPDPRAFRQCPQTEPAR